MPNIIPAKVTQVFSRPLAVALLTFVLAVLGAAVVLWRLEHALLEQKRAEVSDRLASNHAHAIQDYIDRALSATYALAALVRQGHGVIANFDAVASAMLPFYPGAAALQLAPGGVIRQITPLAGNEKAIGHNLLQDPARTKEAFLARDTGRLTLAGPFELMQGGLGAVGRLPVFLEDEHGQPTFWGFTNVLIRFPEVLEPAHLSDLIEQGFDYELWRLHPDTGEKQIIATSASAALIDPVGHPLDLPNGTWTLSLSPRAGWRDVPGFAFRAALGLAFSLLLAFLAYYSAAKRGALRALAESQTWLEAKTVALETEVQERQRTEQELRDSESRYRAMLEAMPDLFFIFDRQGIYHYIHAPDPAALLAPTAQLLGRSVRDVLPAGLAGIVVQRLQEAFVTGQMQALEFALEIAGEPRFFLGRIMAYAPDRALALIEDITERLRIEEALAQVRAEAARHASEQRLLAFVEQGLVGVAEADRQGRLVRVNDRYCEIVGYPREELLGRRWSDLTDPEDRAMNEQLVDSLFNQGQPYVVEMRYRRKTGEQGWASLAAGLTRDPDGAPRSAVALVLDITERKQVEQDLRASEQRFRELNADLERQVAVRTAEARAASAAKSEFLAHMSHEIRTPLNAVLGLAQVLNREPLTANQRDMVERIQAAGQSLLALINDVLDFSKIEAGQLRLEPRPFDLGTLLVKLDSLLGQAAQAKGLALRVEAPVVPPGWLVGDGLRLEQVLLNLMGNAIKFTEQGEVTLRVQLRETGEAAVRLRFEVRDTGIGIAPEALAGLFQPFTQAEAGITRRFGGTGLGLSICKRLVELMGGVIGVDSQVGQGSMFWFELPLRRAAAGETEAMIAHAPVLPAGPRLAGIPLLVVDDSAINRDVVERALALEGARVTLAADGQQALQHLKAQPAAFAAVLMDIQMPVLDGLSATRAIRSELGLTGLPVIALTAGVLVEQQQAARAAGVNDFLAKPLDLEQMVATLLRWTHPPAPADNVPQPTPETPAPGAAAQNRSAGLPEIPGFDAHQVALTFGDDREFFLELVGMFCASFRDTAEEVRADLATGAREAAARRLHTLKGTAGNLGALALMHSAQALERAVIDGEPDWEPRLAEFATQLDDLMQAVAPWLREYADPAGYRESQGCAGQ